MCSSDLKHKLHLSDEACTGSAICLHYSLLLAALSMMAVKGIVLTRFVFFDEIHGTGAEHWQLDYVGALAVPTIIVGVTSLIGVGLGDHAYGNDAL